MTSDPHKSEPDAQPEGPAEVPEESEEYVVVVGVSDTSNSPTALAWAMDLVRARSGRLIAVRASQQGGGFNTVGRSAPGIGSRPLEPEEERLREDVVSVLGEEAVSGPDARVDVRVFRGETWKVLRNVSRNASLLVLDAPRNPVTRPLLAPRVVYSVECPVVLMPPSISGVKTPRWRRAFDSMGRAIVRGTSQAGRPGLGRRL